MKNLKVELEKAIMERFKQAKIAQGLEKELSEYTEEKTLEKYKGTKIKRDKWEYELFAVKCECDTEEYNFKMNEVNTTLIYTITSELTKEQKAELKKATDKWSNDKYMGWMDEKKFKVKLWIEECYDLDIDTIIEDKISLSIDGKII